MINACVRCSEMERAQSFHDQMVQAGLQPNEVKLCYTIFNILDYIYHAH